MGEPVENRQETADPELWKAGVIMGSAILIVLLSMFTMYVSNPNALFMANSCSVLSPHGLNEDDFANMTIWRHDN